jgi:hypothetical protein
VVFLQALQSLIVRRLGRCLYCIRLSARLAGGTLFAVLIFGWVHPHRVAWSAAIAAAGVFFLLWLAHGIASAGHRLRATTSERL